MEFTVVDTQNPQNVEEAIQDNTVAIYFETPTNPLMRITCLLYTSPSPRD